MNSISRNLSGKKRNKKSKKYRKLDGKYEIPYLKHQKTFESKSEQVELTSKEQDDYVLQSLLKNSGVNSALGHDEIIGSCSMADIDLVEAEASTVAKRASEILKNSKKNS